MKSIESLIQESEDRHKAWRDYVKNKRATTKSEPGIETLYGDENVLRELPARRAQDEMTQRAFHPEMFRPGYEELTKTGMQTGPESPASIGARAAQLTAERNYGIGGLEEQRLAQTAELNKMQYGEKGYYPQQLASEKAFKEKELGLKGRELDITAEALNKFTPVAGMTGMLGAERPFVMWRDENGNYRFTFPTEGQGGGAPSTLGVTTSMPAPGVQSFTPGETNWQQPPTEQTQSYNYLRKSQQPQTGEALATRFGNAQTAEDKQRILSEMTTEERGLLRQHLLTRGQTNTIPSGPATMPVDEQRRRRQALLMRGIR